MRLLAFQLEPALAMLRHARLRVLIADEVGLGKTIQTGIILRQLSSETEGFRAIVLTPAGLREQWRHELLERFTLPVTLADTAWLLARTRDLPSDINPWSLPGIHVASLDLVKRPEVLRALEDVSWDIAVVDEVHSAGLGTARLAAADAIACTARRVLLLTATPPDGDPAHFDTITRIGRLRTSAPITQFRRTRSDTGVCSRRKSIVLPVRLSKLERRMHRLLDRYTLLVWAEAGARQDVRARLAAVVLRKRALSSASSLALSVRRRLALLGSTAEPLIQQLTLPLGDEDPLDDQLADDVIGAAGLSDVALERACLEEIAAVAARASQAESKLSLVSRLVSRTAEPMIIFTEYRDTLSQLARVVERRRQVLTLHGAMTPGERAAVQKAFNTSTAVLLATDAASEGLNLHERCRLVVHFELPWTPSRLEQRTGRVDRLGQSRTVHEVLLVARHTCERLVLAPLLKRARTAVARGGGTTRMAALTESAVATAVMRGMATVEDPPAPPRELASIEISDEAEVEALRLTTARRLTVPSDVRFPRLNTADLVVTCKRRTCRSALIVVEVRLEWADGRSVHSELVPVSLSFAAVRCPRTTAGLKAFASGFIDSHASRAVAIAEEASRRRFDIASAQYMSSVEAAAGRERDVLQSKPFASRRLVQVGLFDSREANALAASRRAASLALIDADERLSDLSHVSLRTRARVIALRFGSDVAR